ncbi:MAG TPA: chemotaxis protein CheW [Candidatus Hydrogenedentes bacterium]|nr:chemotaxis protein CheW [Candidatus Hydrogenedentota bacterium]HRK35072.1 chemotaxis protein CheW [Candidatus Hydrogenedentota bacterium]
MIREVHETEQNNDGEIVAADLAGQYLTFLLDREIYGIDILKVQEIVGLLPVTKVPRTPAHVHGVINLRGNVVPVIQLRAKFGMQSQEDTRKTCIVVVQVAGASKGIAIGIIVDEVSEVLSIANDQLAPAPEFGSSVDAVFILGIGKVGDRDIVLLDIDRVLSWGDLTMTRQAATA